MACLRKRHAQPGLSLRIKYMCPTSLFTNYVLHIHMAVSIINANFPRQLDSDKTSQLEDIQNYNVMFLS